MQTDTNISLSVNNIRISIYVSSSPEANKESVKAVKQRTRTFVRDVEELLSKEPAGSSQTNESLKSGSTNKEPLSFLGDTHKIRPKRPLEKLPINKKKISSNPWEDFFDSFEDMFDV